MFGFGKKKENKNTIAPEVVNTTATPVEKAEKPEKIDSGMKATAARMMSGQFDMNDMLTQLKQIKKMSNFGGVLKMVPGMGAAVGAMKEKIKDGSVDRQINILTAMTADERNNPDKIFANAKTRIAETSKTSVREVEQLIKQYGKMKQQMAMVQRMGGMENLMEKLKKGMPGGGNAPVGM